MEDLAERQRFLDELTGLVDVDLALARLEEPTIRDVVLSALDALWSMPEDRVRWALLERERQTS